MTTLKNIEKVQQMSRNKTKEGGVAYKNTLKEDLVELFTLGLLNGTFYTNQEDVIKNAGNLMSRALVECPDFATKCAIYGATEANLKLVPTVWLVYVSTLENKQLFKGAFPKIIRNFNMLHTFMEVCRKGGIREGLGRGVKNVVNARFIEMINEYHATRSKNTLSEIAKVTRPLLKDDQDFQKLMKYVSNGELTIPRAVALKTVIEGLQNGVYSETMDALVRDHSIQLEEVKHSVSNLVLGDKQRLYATVYERLSYSALILNLVALERVFATQTRKEENYNRAIGRYIVQDVVLETDIPVQIVNMVTERIANEEAFRKSKMLPFALINAEKRVITPEFKKALGELLKKVVENAFDIDNDTKLRLGIDTSGSMGQDVVPGLTTIEVATLFGGMIRKAHKNTNMFAVATQCKEVQVMEQHNVFELAERIKNTKVGLETYFEQLLQGYDGEKYIILITDNEPADNLEKKWIELKNKPEGARLIIWQIQNSGHQISRDKSVTYVRGCSDRLLGLIKTIIENKGNQLDIIEAIEV